MAFGRKKGDPQINSFGPIDTLLAASGTLVGEQRAFLLKALTTDVFVEAAIESARAASHKETEMIDHVCRVGFANAMAIAKQGYGELDAVKLLVAGCLQLPPHEVNMNDHLEAVAFAIAAIKGGTRMLQLRRDEQAMAAIAFGTMLVRFACLDDADGTDIYVATWGPNGENKCTFYVQPDLSISWTPDTEEHVLFTQDNAIIALAELERALGKEVSFSEELNANNDFLQSLIESGAATFEKSTESFFKWDPPLPNQNQNGAK